MTNQMAITDSLTSFWYLQSLKLAFMLASKILLKNRQLPRYFDGLSLSMEKKKKKKKEIESVWQTSELAPLTLIYDRWENFYLVKVFAKTSCQFYTDGSTEVTLYAPPPIYTVSSYSSDLISLVWHTATSLEHSMNAKPSSNYDSLYIKWNSCVNNFYTPKSCNLVSPWRVGAIFVERVLGKKKPETTYPSPGIHNRLKFKVFLLDWLPFQSLKKPVFPTIQP